MLIFKPHFSMRVARCSFLVDGINPFHRDGVYLDKVGAELLKDSTQGGAASIIEQVAQVSMLRVVLPWMIGLGVLTGTLAGGLQFGLRRGRSVAAAPRPSQGRLLAALRTYRPGGADSDRVELPAAAITSLSDSEDRAGPCSRYRKHDAARPGSRWNSGGGL